MSKQGGSPDYECSRQLRKRCRREVTGFYKLGEALSCSQERAMLAWASFWILDSFFIRKKRTETCTTAKFLFFENEASGIRTPDNLIKSQVLYRLS